MMRSDSPPAYDSALSKKLTPALRAASRHSIAVSRPSWAPNDTHEPNESTLTWRPLRPRRRYSMTREARARERENALVLLADVVATSDAVAATRSRNEKVAAIAALLRTAAPDEIATTVGF